MNPTVRVEKRKWDGTISAVDPAARLVPAPGSALAWDLAAGSERTSRGAPERLAHDELWVTVPGEWWVLCAEADDKAIVGLVLHASVPVDLTNPGVIIWVDLDLDFEVYGDEITLEDEAEFHEHAGTMAYPPEVIKGAWQGISQLAPRYTTREWPFDGWLERAFAQARAQAAADGPATPE